MQPPLPGVPPPAIRSSGAALQPGDWLWLPKSALEPLVAVLADGHRVIGPQVADGAIVWRDLRRAADLPAGWLDEQDGGHYRLRQDPEAGAFDHVCGPHSLKNFLFPPRETVARFVREGDAWRMDESIEEPPALAVIGARGCDLAALAIQDRVFLGGDYQDPCYRRRREKLFLVAVNCRRAAPTCFCHSMGCGPACTAGFDLALTEYADRFACEIGTAAGAAVLDRLPSGPDAAAIVACTPEEIGRAREVPQRLAERMRARLPEAGEPRPRSLETDGLRDLLFSSLEHPRWQEVAERCLSCTNCTLVCPTCFCAGVTEVADLAGERVERERHWASCFSLDHARMHGSSVRHTTASRYRQWLTHKLAGWIDQFGTSGCTGCGRCITWCPVGIDLTEEVAVIRADPTALPEAVR
jgi:sulfhydrogenase subunit beta (sulfur reductase)